MSERLFVAEFEREEDVLAAAREARRRGWSIDDVYTPYPVHGLDKVMGLRPSRLTWACFLFGLAGCAGALWFQGWASADNWPINVGGKPWNSLPAFIPITFELTVLLAGVGTVLTFWFIGRLFPWKKPYLPKARITNDRFVMVLCEKDAAFDEEETAELFKRFHALSTEVQLRGESS